MNLRIAVITVGALALVMMSGCQGVKKRTDNAQLKTGMRFDESGRLTDQPEVSVPLWNSKGLKEKPRDVTPARD